MHCAVGLVFAYANLEAMMRNCKILLSAIVGLFAIMPSVGLATQLAPGYSPDNPITVTPINGVSTYYNAESGLWYDPAYVEIFDIIDPLQDPLFDWINLPTGVDGTVTFGTSSATITGGTQFDFSPDVSHFMLSYTAASQEPLQIGFVGGAVSNFKETLVVPLPSSALAGFALLGVLGLGQLWLRKKPIAHRVIW